MTKEQKFYNVLKDFLQVRR